MRRATASRWAFRDSSVTPSRLDVNGEPVSERISRTVWCPEHAAADVGIACARDVVLMHRGQRTIVGCACATEMPSLATSISEPRYTGGFSATIDVTFSNDSVYL